MKVTHRPIVAVWFSTVLFGVFHMNAGVYGFVVTLGAGFFLAVVFLHARQFSRKRAYWTTAAIHVSVNSIALVYSVEGSPQSSFAIRFSPVLTRLFVLEIYLRGV